MNESVLRFRELTVRDIPAVISLCHQIWNGEDYIPTVIDSWIQKSVPLSSYTYGAFYMSSSSAEILVALGRIRFLSRDIAWLEGGRVDPKYQKQGIGVQLAQYALEYARTRGSRYAQYDTWSQNYGSIAVARHLGFYQKKYVECMEIQIHSMSLPPSVISSADLTFLSPEEAFGCYQDLPNGPDSEINIGWAYRPFLLQSFIAMASGSLWIQYRHALAHQMSSAFTEANEKPNSTSFWITFYGDPQDVHTLCICLLHQIQIDPLIRSLGIYCSESLSPIFLSLGASYLENIKSGVLLFEKQLL